MKSEYVRSIGIVALLVVLAQFPVAQEVEHVQSIGFDSTYQVGDQHGYGVSDRGFAPISYAVREPEPVSSVGTRSLGTSWGGAEFKAIYEYQWIVPAFRWGRSTLFADTNVTIRSRTGVSPISASQGVRVTATPIAFLNAYAGASIATGWNLGVLRGLGKVDRATGEVDDRSFPGVVTRAVLGGTFQFDVAAVIPGQWNHIVIVVSPQFTHSALSSAGGSSPWSFENDDGANYNGWSRQVTAILGYQPPFSSISTAGLLYDSDELIGSAVARAEESALAPFDAGFRTDRFGLLIDLRLGESRRHSVTVIPQIQRNRLISDETVFNAGLQRRETVGSYWDFYRVVLRYRLRI